MPICARIAMSPSAILPELVRQPLQPDLAGHSISFLVEHVFREPVAIFAIRAFCMCNSTLGAFYYGSVGRIRWKRVQSCNFHTELFPGLPIRPVELTQSDRRFSIAHKP